MKNRKLVLSFFNIYENDSLKGYLEEMALKGWRLTRFDNLFLHFQACPPHSVHYCVEVMERGGPFTSNLSHPLRRYREFCREAGWDYRGTNGYLHVFSAETPDAIPVETDSRERYDNIHRACASSYRSLALLFILFSLMNLYTCYQRGTLLCSNGAVVFLLLISTLWSVGNFALWRYRAQRALRDTGALPSIPWRTVLLKNALAVFLVLIFCGAVFWAVYSGRPSGTGNFLLLYLTAFAILFAVFSGLISLLREKTAFSRTANIAIYWGTAIVMVILVTGILSAIIFRHLLR